jgi:hypothetical protein
MTNRAIPPGENGAATALDETNPARRKPPRISTVSHTLDAALAERLRLFAFRQRVSESAVLEFALREFFSAGGDSERGERLRAAGATLRRRTVRDAGSGERAGD